MADSCDAPLTRAPGKRTVIRATTAPQTGMKISSRCMVFLPDENRDVAIIGADVKNFQS